MNRTPTHHVATAANLSALTAADRTGDVRTLLTAMDDTERTGVLFASLALVAGYAKELHKARGWDVEETAELLHAAATSLQANKGESEAGATHE